MVGFEWYSLFVQVTSELPSSEVPSSQPDCFCGEAWQAMVSDLEPHASQILEQFCIREIIRMVSGCLRDVASALLSLDVHR